MTSDEDLDRQFDLAFDETAGGVKVTIKRRGMRRLFGGWFEDDDTRITIQVPTKIMSVSARTALSRVCRGEVLFRESAAEAF